MNEFKLNLDEIKTDQDLKNVSMEDLLKQQEDYNVHIYDIMQHKKDSVTKLNDKPGHL